MASLKWLTRVAATSLSLLSLANAAVYYTNYSTVVGYFLQDLPSTNDTTFNYTAENFGLIDRPYQADSLDALSSKLTPWQRFYRQVQFLNEVSPPSIQYKVLFMGRHGEGWHNAAESYYGTPAWNCYWAELNGNGTASWSDAKLTENGVAQALVAHDFWQHELDEQHIHPPDSYFVSPLMRTLQTAYYTFTGLRLPEGAAKFIPLIVERFRENISIHTCDRRSNKTVIHNAFPTWPIEPNFTECDELWNGVTGETDSSEVVRSIQALDQVFFGTPPPANPSSTRYSFPPPYSPYNSGLYVSITSHSGEISSLLEAIGHRPFGLNTGAVIPALVKAEIIKASPPSTQTQPWTTSAHCTAPPVTSLANCVCGTATGATAVTTPLVPTGGCQ